MSISNSHISLSFLIHLELKRQLRLHTLIFPSRTIPDSRPKSAKCSLCKNREKIGERDVCESLSLIVFSFPRTLCQWLWKIREKEVQNSTLNQRSYIWISACTLRRRFSANLCTDAASVHRLLSAYMCRS